jgi:hypothetical protein
MLFTGLAGNSLKLKLRNIYRYVAMFFAIISLLCENQVFFTQLLVCAFFVYTMLQYVLLFITKVIFKIRLYACVRTYVIE